MIGKKNKSLATSAVPHVGTLLCKHSSFVETCIFLLFSVVPVDLFALFGENVNDQKKKRS